MIVIHTITKEGESLPYEVLQGLVANKCDHLIHISSEADVELIRKYRIDRKCATSNLQKVIKNRCWPFLFIDSDIELVSGAIERILGYAETYDFVYWRADAGSKSHGLFCANKNVLAAVPFQFKFLEKCNVCEWIKEIEKQFKVHMIAEPRLRQIRRIEWQR